MCTDQFSSKCIDAKSPVFHYYLKLGYLEEVGFPGFAQTLFQTPNTGGGALLRKVIINIVQMGADAHDNVYNPI
jgi:hypothetical protein